VKDTRLRVAWLRVTAKTVVPWATPARTVKKSYDAWRAFLAEFNAGLDADAAADAAAWGSGAGSGAGGDAVLPRPHVRMTGDVWVRMATEIAAVEGTMLAIIIATAFAVGAIVVFTGNVVVALLALVSLLAIVVSVLAVFTLAGWSLGGGPAAR